MTQLPDAPRIVVAGGGTAGHIEPAMNLADAVRRLEPSAVITALGTAKGLDTTLIPARGYPLELIPPVPLPRALNRALMATPGRVREAVAAAGAVLDRVGAEVVVGFGGYVAVPAYLAARSRSLPIVVHEANAKPGLANRGAARLTPHVFTASTANLPHATVIGIPLRPAISQLDRAALRAEARQRFGLDPDRPTLLVFGGSQGARSINWAVSEAAEGLRSAGVQVLHVIGAKNELDIADGPVPYVVVPYVEQMQYAYAAADLALCRCGAMTVAELSAVGLPAIYVPYPVGNGEQRFNAMPVVEAGGAVLVDDSELTPQWVLDRVVPIVTDPSAIARMSTAAASAGSRDADLVLARHVLTVVEEYRRFGKRRQAVPGKPGTPGTPPERTPMRPTRDADAGRPADWEAPGRALVRSAATDVVPPLADLGRVHIIGIAGAGMSGLARILLERGIDVSGCEARDSLEVARLRALGAEVLIGHSPDHLRDVDTFVYTTAINPKQEELVAARASGMPVLRRAAALAAALEDRRCVAISGTHGKTTTTSLLTVGAQACGVDPSFAIGGNLYETGRNAHLGSGDLAIVEADESDGSFLLTRPAAAVVTNVEADHLENHGDLAGIYRAFEQFVDRVEAGGLVLACADDAGAQHIAGYARQHGHRVLSYGESDGADVRVANIVALPDAVEFDVEGPALAPRHVRVGSLVGRHIALNAAAALAMAADLGLDVDTVITAWATFGGVHRRFESHGTGGGVRVYDDYAHHPTEIAASLTAARSSAGDGRLIAVFQPGTYSRTQTFAREFGQALAIADIAIVMDIFPAREEPIPGVTGATISDLVPLPPDRVILEERYAAVPGRVAEVARPGDLVLTMGIGNVYLLCDDIRQACADAAPRRDGEGEL